MREIGKNIRAARLRRGMTQDELAERLHVSRQTVSNYETGRSRPDVEMLLRAAEQLEVDVQVLLYGEPLRPERRREWLRMPYRPCTSRSRRTGRVSCSFSS